MNQSPKSLGQIGESMYGEELMKELQPRYNTNRKARRELLPNVKSGIYTRGWAN